jgi:5'/3'-nucleotidase SurE
MRQGLQTIMWVFLLLLGGAQLGSARELNILLANDDGFEAPGLVAVRTALQAAGHHVTVVAPRTDQSGSSVKISTAQIAVKEESPGVWVVDGSPADAVWVGLQRVFKQAPPDLVISGANRGQNLGAVSNLSGTVGAAVMAAMNDVPAIAVSVGIDFKEAAEGFPSTLAAYPGAAEFIVGLVARLSAQPPRKKLLPAQTLLNVNYPALLPKAIKGARWADLGRGFGYAAAYREGDAPDTVKLAFGPDATKYTKDSRADTARFATGYITLSLLDTSWLAPRDVRADAAARLGNFVKP